MLRGESGGVLIAVESQRVDLPRYTAQAFMSHSNGGASMDATQAEDVPSGIEMSFIAVMVYNKFIVAER